MKIRHLVHSCLLVEVAGRRLLIDPGAFSTEAVRGLGADVLAGIDAVLVTHQHPDHLDRGLLEEVLEHAADAEVLAEPETAALLSERADGAEAVDPGRLHALGAGNTHELGAVEGQAAVRIDAVGGQHAIIHPDIPRVGNAGLVITAERGRSSASPGTPSSRCRSSTASTCSPSRSSPPGRRWQRPSTSCAR